jgi:hypothetical protein
LFFCNANATLGIKNNPIKTKYYNPITGNLYCRYLESWVYCYVKMVIWLIMVSGSIQYTAKENIFCDCSWIPDVQNFVARKASPFK